MPFGYGHKRKDACCPRCESLERHRLAHYFLKDRIGTENTTLHVAPERPVEKWLRQISTDYLSMDKASDAAMVKMDLCELDLPDKSRTLVWCSHVLEHIEDDRQAMREMYRVLKPGGIALVQVPLQGHTTYEEPGARTASDRKRVFGQWDHVRVCGLDIL